MIALRDDLRCDPLLMCSLTWTKDTESCQIQFRMVHTSLTSFKSLSSSVSKCVKEPPCRRCCFITLPKLSTTWTSQASESLMPLLLWALNNSHLDWRTLLQTKETCLSHCTTKHCPSGMPAWCTAQPNLICSHYRQDCCDHMTSTARGKSWPVHS